MAEAFVAAHPDRPRRPPEIEKITDDYLGHEGRAVHRQLSAINCSLFSYQITIQHVCQPRRRIASYRWAPSQIIRVSPRYSTISGGTRKRLWGRPSCSSV